MTGSVRAVPIPSAGAAPRRAVRYALLENVSDVVVVLSAAGIIEYASPSSALVWGETAETLTGTPWWRMVQSAEVERARELLERCLSAPGESVRGELRLRLPGDDGRHFELILSNRIADRQVRGIVATFRDIGDRKLIEDELMERAFYDSVTKLPNRALFLNRLNHALTRASRHGSAVAVIFLDLDNFKLVNDTLGHEAGDELLAAVGQRLQACIRSEDTAARLGGDEFTILLEEIRDRGDVIRVAEQLTERLAQSVRLSGREVFVTASLGIALSAAGHDQPETLLREADLAMYEAKRGGKAQYRIFDASMDARLIDQLALDAELRQGISLGQLELAYQPVVHLASGAVEEVEALVRWRHPVRGLLLPSEFIPHAEEAGLIVPIGQRVLEDACRQGAIWQRRPSALWPLRVSVNLSARQFREPRLVEVIAAALDSSGLEANRLQLEITESAAAHDAGAAIGTMRRLKELGVRLAIDDFGTGYSSLAHLKEFPIDVLKIDQSFISGLGKDRRDAPIVRTIIGLAKILGLSVTAEGIETREQLEKLRELRCDSGQGFYYSEPVAAERIDELLAGPRPTYGQPSLRQHDRWNRTATAVAGA